MKQRATYIGLPYGGNWDIDHSSDPPSGSLWVINEGKSYPYLRHVPPRPSADTTDPADEAAGVSPDKTITVTYSENMQDGTDIGDITLKKDGVAAAFTYSIAGAVLAIEFEFLVEHVSGDKLEERPCFTGMASARNSKGGIDDKAANKCLTAATKYFALNLFRIPTGDYHDADAQEDAPARKNGNGRAPEPDPDKYVEGALAIIAEEPSFEFCMAWWKKQAQNRREHGLTPAHIDVLSRAIAERWPDEVAKAKAQKEAA